MRAQGCRRMLGAVSPVVTRGATGVQGSARAPGKVTHAGHGGPPWGMRQEKRLPGKDAKGKASPVPGSPGTWSFGESHRRGSACREPPRAPKRLRPFAPCPWGPALPCAGTGQTHRHLPKLKSGHPWGLQGEQQCPRARERFKVRVRVRSPRAWGRRGRAGVPRAGRGRRDFVGLQPRGGSVRGF